MRLRLLVALSLLAACADALRPAAAARVSRRAPKDGNQQRGDAPPPTCIGGQGVAGRCLRAVCSHSLDSERLEAALAAGAAGLFPPASCTAEAHVESRLAVSKAALPEPITTTDFSSQNGAAPVLALGASKSA